MVWLTVQNQLAAKPTRGMVMRRNDNDNYVIDDDNFYVFRKYKAVLAVFSLCVFLYDYVTDVLLVATYLRDGQVLYGILTFVFVFVPSLVRGFFSFRWLVNDDPNYRKKNRTEKLILLSLMLITHLLPVGIIYR